MLDTLGVLLKFLLELEKFTLFVPMAGWPGGRTLRKWLEPSFDDASLTDFYKGDADGGLDLKCGRQRI